MAQENESLLDPHKPLPEAVMAAERAEKQVRIGGRERRREGRKEGRKEGEREGGREGGKRGGKEEGREVYVRGGRGCIMMD